MFFRKEEEQQLKMIYLMHSIQCLALSTVSIFVPTYLLTLGYSLEQVIKFFVFYYVCILLFAFVAAFLSSKIGLYHTLFFRIPLVLIFILLLYYLPEYKFSIYFIAFFGGVEEVIYWVPLHIIFAKNTKDGQVGGSTSQLLAWPKVLSIFGPFIGGLFLATFGFRYLFLFILIVLIISILPILSVKKLAIKEEKPRLDFSSWGEIFRANQKYFFSEVADNIGRTVEGIIWPVFIFLTLKSIIAVGSVGTLLLLGETILIFTVGRYSDKYDKRKLIKIGALLLAMAWLLRYFIKDEMAIYVITLLFGFLSAFYTVSFCSNFYSLSKSHKLIDFFLLREVFVDLSRIVLMLFCLLIVDNINLSFLVSGFSYLYFLFF